MHKTHHNPLKQIRSTPSEYHISPELAAATHPNHDFRITIIKRLSHSRFPIFLVKCEDKNLYFAMKVFKYTKSGEINEFYQNEARFSFLHHPNIISIISTVDLQESHAGDVNFNISYILMELACLDFNELINLPDFYLDEKLVRTYFHQLIEAMRYLRSHEIAHLDIKPENLLLGPDYRLKLCDFDLSYQQGDRNILSNGTIHFRAPELKNHQCQKPELADIYSAGAVLFCMMLGHMPCLENGKVRDRDMYDLLQNNQDEFWSIHEDISHREQSKSFKELFISMVNKEPEKRPTIEEIKKSAWYQGETYSQSELEKIMKNIVSKINMNK